MKSKIIILLVIIITIACILESESAAVEKRKSTTTKRPSSKLQQQRVSKSPATKKNGAVKAAPKKPVAKSAKNVAKPTSTSKKPLGKPVKTAAQQSAKQAKAPVKSVNNLSKKPIKKTKSAKTVAKPTKSKPGVKSTKKTTNAATRQIPPDFRRRLRTNFDEIMLEDQMPVDNYPPDDDNRYPDIRAIPDEQSQDYYSDASDDQFLHNLPDSNADGLKTEQTLTSSDSNQYSNEHPDPANTGETHFGPETS